MSEPQEHTLNEVKVRKFHSNLLKGGQLTEANIGSEDDFVKKLAGDPDKLIKFRNNLIAGGGFSEESLGGSEAMFSKPFLKKKDVSITSGKSSDITPEKSSKTKEPTEEVDNADLEYQDYHNQTIFDPNQSASIASSYKNKYLADHRNDEAVRVVDAQTQKDMHDASNVIAERRTGIDLEADEKIVKKQMDDLEDDLNTKYNPTDRKSKSVSIRKQLAVSMKDQFRGNLEDYLKANQTSKYEAMTGHPEMIDEWRKQYRRKVPGEVLDAAVNDFQSEFNSVVIENEIENHINPMIEDFKARGHSEEEAINLATAGIESQKRKHFEANMDKKTIERYEIQSQIDELTEENVDGIHDDRISSLYEQVEDIGANLYDEKGRRVKLSEVEDVAEYQLEVNAKIDEYTQDVNFSDKLDLLYDEEFKVYSNLKRRSEESAKAYAQKVSQQQVAPGTLPQGLMGAEKKRQIMLDAQLQQQKVKVDALGQMKFANENIALTSKGKKGYYREVGWDAVRDANHGLFGYKATKAEQLKEFEPAMAKMGEALTEQEMANVAPDIKEELATATGHMADFIVKLATAEATMGVTGVTAAVKTFNAARKITALRKTVSAGNKASRYSIKALNNLERSVIQAGMNEVRFQAGGMEPGTGAAFHYVDKGIGKVVPILLRRGNKHLALIVNSLARNPLTMTASMEIVAATQGAVHAIANDKIVSEEMKLMFGDINDVQRRVAVELMVGAMFGMGEVVKAGKRGIFQTTAEYVVELQKKALDNGRTDVAAALGNIKFKLIEGDWASQEATRTQKKVDYLLKNGVETKEIFKSKKAAKGKGNRVDIKKVNEEFEARAGEDVTIYDKVLGEGSLEGMRAKAKILKKSGVDIDGHSPGNIEVMYHEYQTKKPYAKKIQRYTEAYEIKTRRKTAKSIDKKLKEENIGDGYSESTDAEMEIRKSKQIKRSETEREFMKSYRRTRRDTSKNRVDYWGEKYKRAVQGEWKGTEAKPLTEQMVGTVGRALGLLKSVGLKGKHYDKLKAAERVLNNSLKNEKPLTNEQADTVMKRITDSQNAFTVTAMRKGINDLIRTPRKKSAERLDPVGIDPKTSFIMKAVDRMFNKGAEEVVYQEGTEKQVEKAEKRLTEFRTTELQAEEMLKAREQDPLLHEGENLSVYEGASDAMKSGNTRENALTRRAELRHEAEQRPLTEREMVEYEILNFADGSKMSMQQLIEANRAMRSLINNGRIEFEVKQMHEQLRQKFERYSAVKSIDPKSVDVSAKLIEPNLTGLNKFQKAVKTGRAWSESLPTMMEWLMSRTPGRKPLTGELHAYTDRALKAGNDKAAEVGYFVKEMIDIENQIFGDPKKATKRFEEWREGSEWEIIREGKLTHEDMSIQDALTIRSYAKQIDQGITFRNRGWDKESLLHFENQIIQKGGKEALVWADAVIDNVMPRIWSRVNEGFKDDVGVDLTIIENYFPVARKFDPKTGVGDPFVLHTDPAKNIRSTHTSSSKERNPESSNWYRINKPNDIAFNDMMYRYLDHSMQYVHFQSLVKDMNNVFRNEDVQSVIEDGFTGTANKVIDTMINDIARGRVGADHVTALDKLRSGFVRSKLGLNLLLLPKQLMSVNGYQAELSPAESLEFFKYMGAPDVGVMKLLGRSRDIKLRYEKNQWNRDLAIVETGMLGAKPMAEGKVKLSRGEGLEKLSMRNMKDNMLIMTKYGDYGAIVYGGQAMYRVRYNTYIKKGHPKADASQLAYNDFIKATRRTQQSGAIEDLSHFQKGTMGKMLTQFKNSPLQYLRGEHASLTNMYEGWKQGDAAKFRQGLKNFAIYHIVLPQAFHAASNGFYLGEEDKKWLNDPMSLVTLIGGSLAYYPAMGSLITHLVSSQVKGEGFGIDLGIAGDMFGEIQEMLEIALDVANRAGDPGEFSIGADEVIDFLSGAATYAGVPLQSPVNIVKGWKGYLTGETDDELALLGYSPYMRGDYERSRNFPIIHKHLPENGGDMRSMREEYSEMHGEAATQRQWPRLQKEYLMYEHFGGYDRHVNYIYSNLKPGTEQAKYIYDLYKRQVGDKRPFRKNISITEILKNIEKTDPEFFDMVAEWMAFGVIDESTLKKLALMTTGQYEEAYEY